ncbi:hypothetical protein SEA_MICRODON_78 [Streptomyces phage Microdon]|nr:hypothetical protein SEA_MICRODON_78 [Streptomyces phage Microdon]
MTENTSPAMSNDPAAYAAHHNVMQPGEYARVIHVFESCIHVALTHPSSELEKKGVDNRIRAAAKEWAREHGKTLGSVVSKGWTLGEDESETRHIFSIREGAALESLRRAREI